MRKISIQRLLIWESPRCLINIVLTKQSPPENVAFLLQAPQESIIMRSDMGYVFMGSGKWRTWNARYEDSIHCCNIVLIERNFTDIFRVIKFIIDKSKVTISEIKKSELNQSR